MLPAAIIGFDNEYDAFKLFGSEGARQLYFIVEGVNLCVNIFPEITYSKKIDKGYREVVGNW